MSYYIAITTSNLLCCLLLFFSQVNLPPFMLLYPFIPFLIIIPYQIIKRIISKTIIEIILFMTLFFSFIMFWSNSVVRSIIAYNPYSLTVAVYFILTIVFVISMPKVGVNPFFGIKIPVLYEHPELWGRCQKNASIILSFTLIPQFLLIFYCPSVRFLLTNILLVGSLLIGVIYAGIIGNLHAKKQDKKEVEDLKKQLQKEQGYR